MDDFSVPHLQAQGLFSGRGWRDRPHPQDPVREVRRGGGRGGVPGPGGGGAARRLAHLPRRPRLQPPVPADRGQGSKCVSKITHWFSQFLASSIINNILLKIVSKYKCFQPEESACELRCTLMIDVGISRWRPESASLTPTRPRPASRCPSTRGPPWAPTPARSSSHRTMSGPGRRRAKKISTNLNYDINIDCSSLILICRFR